MEKLVDDPTETFREGIRACRRGNWRTGLRLLTPLAQQEERSGKLPGFFYSYLGHAIARCEGRKHVGLELCRHAVQAQPFQPVNHLNLARTYLLIGNRRLALKSMNEGLAIDPTHRELLALGEEMGVRRPPPLPFLPRQNLLNRWLGRLTYWLQTTQAERRRQKEEEALLGELE